MRLFDFAHREVIDTENDLQKARPVRHKITRTPTEKLNIALWTLFCGCLVGVFFFMTWFMCNPKGRLAHKLKYGQKYLAAADYSHAELEFKRVLEMDATNAEAYQGLMQAAIDTENTEEALQLYNKAAKALADYKDPLERLLELRAVERTDKGDFDGAFSVADVVEQTTGDSNAASLIRALVIDGMLEKARGLQGEEAIELYRRVLKVDHVDATAIYKQMVQIRMDQEDEDALIDMLNEACEVTGDEEFLAMREKFIHEHASLFLPDTFVRDLNNAMAEAAFNDAAAIVRDDLFLQRIAEFAGEVDANGEQTYDFSTVQPADMNMVMYGEYASGSMKMLIIDWERVTKREAAFNELVYVPETGAILAMSQRQRVSDLNTLVDEGGYWRVNTDGLSEIPEEGYYNELRGVFGSGPLTAEELASGDLDDLTEEGLTAEADAEGEKDLPAGNGRDEGDTDRNTERNGGIT